MIRSQEMLNFPLPQGQDIQHSQDQISSNHNAEGYSDLLEDYFYKSRPSKLTPHFLEKSGIAPFQRFLLKNWISQEMVKFRFLRETYAITSKLIDLYLFKREQAFPIESFQHLGIACWILTTKIVGQKLPPICFSQYNKDQINQLQKSVIIILEWQLFPQVYTNLVGQLITNWDIFSTHNGLNQGKYLAETKKSINLYKNLLQILDSLDLVPLSYQFTIQELVLNCFYLENRQNYYGCQHPKSENEINLIIASDGSYKKIFSDFLKQVNNNCDFFQNIHLSAKCMVYILPFLAKGCKNRELANWQVKKMYLVRLVQTQNKEMYRLARNMIKTSSQ